MVTRLRLEQASYAYRTGWSLGPLETEYGPGITAVLGPNGAGKTTLLRLVAGTRRWHGGRMTRDGNKIADRHSNDRHKSTLGFLPQHSNWPPSWRVREALDYAMAVFRVPRADRVSNRVWALSLAGAEPFMEAKFGELSGGQRQRAFLALTLVHEPELLILDEPTVGLDPEERIRWRLVLAELGQTHTILLSTHLLDDITLTADRVHIMTDGRLLWDGSVQELEAYGKAAGPGGPATLAERGYLSIVEGAE